MQSYDGIDTATLESAGKARMARIVTERERDPQFTYGEPQKLASYAETAIILAVFGDVDTGVATVDYFRSMIGE